MFNVTNILRDKFGVDVLEEIKEIPSMGYVNPSMPINVWTAKYFRPISDALWSGKPKAEVLKLWGITKRSKDVSPKLCITDRKEHARINKNHKAMQAFAELRQNMPDRWGATDWKKCK